MAATGITLHHRDEAWWGTIHQCAGWIARCEGYCGWAPTRRKAYQDAYNHIRWLRRHPCTC